MVCPCFIKPVVSSRNELAIQVLRSRCQLFERLEVPAVSAGV